MTDSFAMTPRTKVKRLPARGVYDRATIHAILDAGLICHVGFVDEGRPVVIPTIHVRVGDQIVLHGSPASRMLRCLAAGAEACVTVTHVDGLVLARSAMHHSMNYRSAVVFGRGAEIVEPGRKLAALRALTEQIVPGRWSDTRPPSAEELRRTMVVAIPIDEASAKIRTGPPVDDPADYALPHWAGVVPLRLVAGEPIPDPKLAAGIAAPSHARQYRGPGPA